MEKGSQSAKRYDLKAKTLKFVNRPDLDPLSLEEDDQGLCVEMSCGHAVTPRSLANWCRGLLDRDQYKFKCPALKQGTYQRCDAVWSYEEVCRRAALTTEERQHFEKKMAQLTVAEYCELKMCPGCKTHVKGQDMTNLCVWCKICTAEKKKVFLFCWQCLKEWKGPAPRSDRCNNDGCVNRDLWLLKNCLDTVLPLYLENNKFPSIRACPTCGMLVEHDKTGSKNNTCPRCQVEFCFMCLKLTEECRGGVAPRQTSIPGWWRR